MFTSSIKREAFSRRSCAKTGKEMYVQSFCFAYKIYCFFFFFDVLVAVRVVNVPNDSTVNNNSPIQDYIHPNDQTQPTFEIIPGFKSFTHKVQTYTQSFQIARKIPVTFAIFATFSPPFLAFFYF